MGQILRGTRGAWAWRRRLARRSVLLVLLLLAGGCGLGGGRFDAQNARAHVERLAGAIGSRPAGSTANQEARAYLIETLQLYGFDVRVQEAEAQWREGGRSARVANVIAIRNGQQREAVALVAHYDSVTAGPGAGDDAFGVSVALEAARVLAARESPRYSLMVVFTDGEEDGLMGARALVEDADVRARLRTYLNLEAIGTRDPVPLFETGPGSGPALDAWARAPYPRGGSYMLSVYKALPNDTDATILRGLDVFGLNFAAVGDSHAYHTDRDRADRVAPRALARAGDNVVAIVERLDEGPLDARAVDPVYFSVLDRRAFVMTTTSARLLGIAAVALGLLAWLLLVRQAVRTYGIAATITTFAWATLATGAVVLALLGSVWLLRSARAELHPWHASPWRLYLFMTMMVVAMTWAVRRLASLLPARLRPIGTPAAVWMTTLPVWIAVAVALLAVAVAASYLATIPLLLTALLLPLGVTRPGIERVVSAVSAGVAWVLLAPDAWALLGFAVPVLSRLPLVTPIWLFPLLFLAVGVFLWPPVLGLLVGRLTWRVRHGLAGAVLATLVVVSALLVLMAPAYTAERPQRRAVTRVDNRVSGETYWRLAGNEPGVDIAPGPENVQWQPVAAGGHVGPFHPAGAFVFEGQVPPGTTPPPARVTATVSRRADGVDLEVTLAAHPHERLSVAFLLPEATVPTATSLPGRSVGGRWQASFVNVPPDGLTWRATVPPSQGDVLEATEVWMAVPDLPGADATSGVPSWLSRERTAWHTTAVTVVGVAPDEVSTPQPSSLGVSTFAPTPQGRVHYFDHGAGSTGLVFVHGWGGEAGHWTAQVPVAAGRRAVFVDLPGHGRSDALQGRHTVAAMADAVVATMRSAGLTRAVVVGHSLGALVGWHVALRAPDRVEALVSVDGTLLPFLQDAEAAARFTADITPADMGPFIERLTPTLFTDATPSDIRTTVLSRMAQTPPLVLAELMSDVSTTGGPPFAPAVLPVPALALEATGPGAEESSESRLRALFPALDYRPIPNAGHYLMLERPREVNDAIAGFLLGRGLLR